MEQEASGCESICGGNGTMTELKPCPFCGHTVIAIHSGSDYGDGYTESHWVECCGCYVTTNTYDEIEQAINAWNQREGAI